MPTLLCETVTGRSMAELIAARDAATAGDMVELRLDGIPDVDVAGALHGRRLPAIVTCRPAWEGGRFDGSEEDRHAILARAMDLGAEFVDVEWQAVRGLQGAGGAPGRGGFCDLVRRHPARSVVSSHDFAGVPADLQARARDMRATGAGVIKIAVAATRLTDTLPLIEIARAGDAVVIGMGEAGLPSRLLAGRYGSRWTYAGNAVAPGQIPAARMLTEFRYRRVGSDTRLFGVISVNAMPSFSPSMHNAAFAAAAIDAVYVPLQAADFDDFLSFASAMAIEGASVTIPFKLDALRAAERTDARTRKAGAANTLRRIGPAWEATNTDIEGFLAPLAEAYGEPVRGARAAVLGAGGSARAVVVALLSRGVRVTLHARREDQACEVLRAVGSSHDSAAGSSLDVGGWPVPPGSWDLLVNCTPLGGAGRREESPLPGGPFSGRLVYDLTYGPGESGLVREAREAGCLTLDGLPMLIAQAERQFEWWTGQRPAPDVMRDAAYGRLHAAGSLRQQAAESRSRGVSS